MTHNSDTKRKFFTFKVHLPLLVVIIALVIEILIFIVLGITHRGGPLTVPQTPQRILE
jgi:hypothetical protein